MSKVKSPQEKKRLSLELERRNVYGENGKSSRKNIRKGKQRRHMEERRTAKAPLLLVKGIPDEEVAAEAEHKAKQLIIHAKKESFTKVRDKPLGEVLNRKRTSGKRFIRASRLSS